MPDPLEARKLLREYGIRPSKKLGQNFIVDAAALDEIVSAAELDGSQEVIEIGAGLGALTLRLAALALQVAAVEVDERLLPILQSVLSDTERVKIVVGDALELDLGSMTSGSNYYVVANIPYSITSALIRRFLEAANQPKRMALTVQAEVAERVVAEPGQMSLLALSVQIYGSPQIWTRIPASSFYPQPEVNSAVIGIDVHEQARVELADIGPLFRLARAGFSQRRKMLKNSLATVLGQIAAATLEQAGIDPTSRAQELGVDEWARLAHHVSRGPNA